MGVGFETIVGSSNVVAPGAAEAMLDGVSVEEIVRPGSAEELAACLAVAREGRRLVLCGGATKLHWGNAVQATAITRLETTRLDAELDLQPDEGILTASAGVRLGRIADAAQAVGKKSRLPRHPAEATLGGTLAADPIEPRYSLDHRLRADVLGLEVALPNGEVTRSGGKVVKNVTGFDLVRLYCGSLGSLGAITEATLRLRSAPEERCLLRSDHADLDAAFGVVATIVDSRVDAAGVALTRHADRASVWCLLEGSVASIDRARQRVPGDADDVAHWDDLEQACAAPERLPGRVRLRVSARPSDTRAICAAVLGQAGADAMRLVLPIPGCVFAEIDPQVLPLVWESAAEAGWALFIEDADPETKARFDAFGPSIQSLELMHALKTRFDPGAVLAPGRFAGRL